MNSERKPRRSQQGWKLSLERKELKINRSRTVIMMYDFGSNHRGINKAKYV